MVGSLLKEFVREFDAKFVLLFPFRHIFIIIIINRELPLRIISRGTRRRRRRRRRRIETRRDRENTTNNRRIGAFLSRDDER